MKERMWTAIPVITWNDRDSNPRMEGSECMSDREDVMTEAYVAECVIEPFVAQVNGKVTMLKVTLELRVTPEHMGRLVPGQRLDIVTSREQIT